MGYRTQRAFAAQGMNDWRFLVLPPTRPTPHARPSRAAAAAHQCDSYGGKQLRQFFQLSAGVTHGVRGTTVTAFLSGAGFSATSPGSIDHGDAAILTPLCA